MLFHSLGFLAFFVVFAAVLPFVKARHRVIYASLGSFAFYSFWNYKYLTILLGLIIFAYVFTLKEKATRLLTFLTIFVGLAPLAIFKYGAFLLSGMGLALNHDPSIQVRWPLPLGISFITFTALAYVIDVQAGRREREKSLWNVALYVSFFPHLIAGPIMRAGELIPQFSRLAIRWPMLKPALFLFAIGVLKKVGVADQLAPTVDAIFASRDARDAGHALLALYGFAVQIYADFSGYTDMAIALAMFLGITFPQNFDRPYYATSIRDFWRRWHMTLSRWLRDYLYFPLGGSRSGEARTIFAIMATMGLGGLWHGAGMTFIVWGLLHGALVALEHVGQNLGVRLPLPAWGRRILVFHAVSIGWIFFRASSVADALDILGGFFQPGGWEVITNSPMALALIAICLIAHRVDTIESITKGADKLPTSVVIVASAMVLLICSAISAQNPSAFIYFDF